MTDEQVADIYAIARESFSGGQREIQLQSYPFHMTAENMAKFGLDPNIEFWKNLKDGSDHFEVTKAEPSVLVCGKHYVFDATTKERFPAANRAPRSSATTWSRRRLRKRTKGRRQGRRAGRIRRQAGAAGLCGRRPKSGFRRLEGCKRPGRAGERPQEIVLNDRTKPIPAAVKVATAYAEKKRAATAQAPPAPARPRRLQSAPTTVAAAAAPQRHPAECSAG